MAALKSSEGNIIWWNSFFSPVASELILNVLNHLAWNYVVWGRRCSVLWENRGKVRRGLRFALSNPYINICTPWPCEPLNLCRLIMSWKLDARFMHNHRKKYTCLLATKDPFPHRFPVPCPQPHGYWMSTASLSRHLISRSVVPWSSRKYEISLRA